MVRALSNGKKRLFQQIADKSISIGCRGYYTAECLDRMGIHNYHVIGCPSAYSTSLNGVIEKMPVPQLRKIVFNMTGGSRGNDRILDLVMKSGVDSRLIMQGMREMPDAFDHRGVGKDVKEYWKSKAEIFYRLEEWEDYLKYENFTFSFGTRLHGNMLSFLEGVPTLWITHDDRTQEIIDVFKFPHLNIDRFERRIKGMRYLEQVMECCIYDEAFYKNFYRMRKTYISFLDENAIHHKLQYVE